MADMTLERLVEIAALTIAIGSAMYLLILLPALISVLRGTELDRSRRRHRRRWHR